MNIRQIAIPVLAIALLLASCTPAAQKTEEGSSSAPAGNAWKKQVTRMIDVAEKEDTVVHHLRDANEDSSLAEMMVNAIKNGSITAYSNVDHQFTTKLTLAALNEMVGSRTDTMVITDPINGKEEMKVIKKEFNFSNVHKYRFLEEWSLDPATGKTEIQIIAIAPVREIFSDAGTFLGIQGMFWIKYNDVQPMLHKVAQLHPRHNLMSQLWDDYFLSDVKPEVAK